MAVTPIRVGLSALALGVILGFLGGVWVRRPVDAPVPVPDRPSPAQEVPGGLVLAIKPQKAALVPPKGLHEDLKPVRHIEVEVKPDRDPRPAGDDYMVDEPPIRVFVDLVRKPDGHLRAVVTADGGRVVGGVDIPDESAPVTAPDPRVVVPRPYRWAVLATRTVPLDRTLQPCWGAEVLYSRSIFTGGLGADRYGVRISMGVRF